MVGTLLNVVAVLVGATAGLTLGRRLPERVRTIILQGIGLTTLLIGMQMALQVQNLLILLASVVLGGVLGELLRIEQRLNSLATWLDRRTGGEGGTGQERFVRGFVTSSLVFCVGPMALVGAIQDGLSGDFRLLAAKSLLDGISAVAFASALGVGVLGAALTVLVYQGAVSGAARLVGGAIPNLSTNPAVLELTAVGGILVLGLGLRLLDVKQIPVANFLPALLWAPALTVFAGPSLARLIASVP